MSLFKRTGLLTIIVVLIAATGLLIYQYGYLVYNDYDYHTSYKDVHGLRSSSPVFINGVRVGKVSSVELDESMHHVDVVLSIKKEIPIPKGSIALLAANSMIDTRMIYIQTSDNETILSHNDKIFGKYDTTILEMQGQIAPIIDGTKYILNTAEKNFNNFNRKIENGLVFETQRDIRDMERDMSSYHNQVNSINKSANGILSSINSLNKKTAAIAKKKDSINTSINSLVAKTQSFASMNINTKAHSFNTTIDTLAKHIGDAANNATTKKLLNDNAAYKNAVKKTANANNSMKELKEDPPGITIIGGN